MTQTITPYLLYSNCEAALDFLSRAFGFEEELRMTAPEGYVNHAEMRLGDGRIMLGDPGDEYCGPKQLGGATFGVYVDVDDVDAHFEQARAAGATISEEPLDQDYGHRRYGAEDPEGHLWWFARPIAAAAADEEGATVSA